MLMLFESEDPLLLANPFFAGDLVATYADVLTPQLCEQFAGRLLVIDRGLGDPLSAAHVADIGPGAYSLERGVELMRGWILAGRRMVTAHVSGVPMWSVAQLLAPLDAYYWVSCAGDATSPAGYQQPDAARIGCWWLSKGVGVSAVYSRMLHAFDLGIYPVGGGNGGWLSGEMPSPAHQLVDIEGGG